MGASHWAKPILGSAEWVIQTKASAQSRRLSWRSEWCPQSPFCRFSQIVERQGCRIRFRPSPCQPIFTSRVPLRAQPRSTLVFSRFCPAADEQSRAQGVKKALGNHHGVHLSSNLHRQPTERAVQRWMVQGCLKMEITKAVDFQQCAPVGKIEPSFRGKSIPPRAKFSLRRAALDLEVMSVFHVVEKQKHNEFFAEVHQNEVKKNLVPKSMNYVFLRHGLNPWTGFRRIWRCLALHRGQHHFCRWRLDVEQVDESKSAQSREAQYLRMRRRSSRKCAHSSQQPLLCRSLDLPDFRRRNSLPLSLGHRVSRTNP